MHSPNNAFLGKCLEQVNTFFYEEWWPVKALLLLVLEYDSFNLTQVLICIHYLRITRDLLLFENQLNADTVSIENKNHAIYQRSPLLRIRITQGVASAFYWKWETLKHWYIVESEALSKSFTAFELDLQHKNWHCAAVNSRRCKCLSNTL